MPFEHLCVIFCLKGSRLEEILGESFLFINMSTFVTFVYHTKSNMSKTLHLKNEVRSQNKCSFVLKNESSFISYKFSKVIRF